MRKQVVILAAVMIPAVLRADVHTALSCSQADVQTAINAAADGDTVQVPAGTATWTTPAQNKPAIQIGQQLTWGIPSTYESKQIMLQGAGIDKTIIIDQTHQGYNESAMQVFTLEGKPIRITGFTFRFGSDTKETEGSINIAGYCKNWRIDHIKFDGPWSGNGIYVGHPDNYGVIDHYVVITSTSSAGGFKAVQLDLGPNGEADSAWAKPLAIGTVHATYIEDCIFDYKFPNGYRSVDGSNGPRWVFRNNISYNNVDVGTHGHDSGPRSNITMEVYNNTFLHTTNSEYYVLIAYRGGTGVVFNNTVQMTAGKWYTFVGLWYYCACPGNGTCGYAACSSYPCEDQPGRGPDENNDGVQDPQPIYEWNNTVNITPHMKGADDCSQENNFIQENRDYYNNTPRPGYIPYPYPHPLTLGDYAGTRALGLSVEAIDIQVTLRWNAITGADHYKVLRNWQEVMTLTNTNYSESRPGLDVVYLVTAYDTGGTILSSEGARVRSSDASISLVGTFRSIVSATIRLRGAGFTVAFPASVHSPELTVVDLNGRTVYRAMLNKTGKTVYNFVWRERPAAGAYFAVVKETSRNDGAILARTKIVVNR